MWREAKILFPSFAHIPIYFAGIRKFLKVDIIPLDIPLLVGLLVFKQLNLGVQVSQLLGAQQCNT